MDRAGCRRDADAFARLYDAWSSRLFALILQIVVDRAQSEEVLQEVFLEVWRTGRLLLPGRGQRPGLAGDHGQAPGHRPGPLLPVLPGPGEPMA